MSILTQALVAEKYGLRLGIDQLAELPDLAKTTIYNQISAGNFKSPTYVDGGKRWADYRDVAAHFGALRSVAA